MPHTWNTSTSVYPHMHAVPMSSGSGVVKFDFAHCWVASNEYFPAAASWVSSSISMSLTPSNQYQHIVRHFGVISPPTSSAQASILLFIKIERPGATDPVDTYVTSKDHETASANFGILFFDLHYQKIRAGTQTQLPELNV